MKENGSSVAYHLIVVLLSVVAAVSLPLMAGIAAKQLPDSWTAAGNGSSFPALIKLFAAAWLVVFINLVRVVRRDRKLAAAARSAGLVTQARPARPGSRFPLRKADMKEICESAREIMIIGCTGASFSQPGGELYQAMCRCRDARVLLLDPREHGAIARSQSIPDPEITPEAIGRQIRKSIEFIKSLRASNKTIRLKLYPDMPLLKMAILGDYVRIRHYHTGLNVRTMPEFVFRNGEAHGGLYMPLYRYFLFRWQDPDIPEYDLDTDELIYHDELGYEVLREPFSGRVIAFDDSQGSQGEPRRYVFR